MSKRCSTAPELNTASPYAPVAPGQQYFMPIIRHRDSASSVDDRSLEMQIIHSTANYSIGSRTRGARPRKSAQRPAYTTDGAQQSRAGTRGQIAAGRVRALILPIFLDLFAVLSSALCHAPLPSIGALGCAFPTDPGAHSPRKTDHNLLIL